MIALEARTLMSGDSIWVDLDYAVTPAEPQPVALLLPAVQASREAARATVSNTVDPAKITDGTSNPAKITDGTSNTIMFAERYA